MTPKVPEKFPLDEIAYIVCLCCKARFHPAFISTLASEPANFTCPKCLGKKPVTPLRFADLAREVRGCEPPHKLNLNIF
jgi:hypothetical protein